MVAASAYMRTISVTSVWQPLADTSLVLTASARVWTPSVPPSQPLDIRVNGGDLAQIPSGTVFTLENVDLSTIEVKGSTGYRVTVIGYTR